MHHEGLQRAIEICDGQAGLAERLNALPAFADRPKKIKQGHIWFWLTKAKKLPPEVAIGIEAVTAGEVPRHKTRPDLWQPEPNGADA